MKVGIIGLGYVGLPLAVRFSTVCEVTGYDINGDYVESLKRAEHFPSTVERTDLLAALARGFTPTAVIDDIAQLDVYIICVPTPLDSSHKPDLAPIRSAVSVLRKLFEAGGLKQGCIISLESTSYPGTTRELLVNELEAAGCRSGSDFFAAFSPERVNPGSSTNLFSVPKLVAGDGTAALTLAKSFYEQVFTNVVPCSSLEAAELAKLLENSYRAVNIALVNELSDLCRAMKVDVYEVINAAATKPFGFSKFTPSAGVGGHCIPIDPAYLIWKAEQLGIKMPTLSAAQAESLDRPHKSALRVVANLLKHQHTVNGAKVALIGAAYKAGIEDWRESATLVIYDVLADLGAEVCIIDPLVASVTTPRGHQVAPLAALTEQVDLSVIVTAQVGIDLQKVESQSKRLINFTDVKL